MISHNGITIDRRSRTISHGGMSRVFHVATSGRDVSFNAICHLILSSGMTVHELFDYAYGDDPDGGPEIGHRIMHIMMQHWPTRYLSELGLECRSWKLSGDTRYSIVPIEQSHDPLLPPAYRRRTLPAPGFDVDKFAEAAE